MRAFAITAILALTATAAWASNAPNFSGRWNFDAAESKNVGMMSMASVTTTISLSGKRLTVDDHSTFSGKTIDDHTIYDLSGAPVQNATKMSGTGTTLSRWNGARLITEWSSEGVAPGSTVTRTETRYLSSDGHIMFVESSQTGEATIVMAFDRAQ